MMPLISHIVSVNPAMLSDHDRQTREVMLELHRHLQASADQLDRIDCADPNAQAIIKAVKDLNEIAANLVAETTVALLPVEAALPKGKH